MAAPTIRLRDWLRAHPAAAAALSIALVANLLAASAWAWSRGGQSTTVVVGVFGDSTAAVAVDGSLQWSYPLLPGIPERGGVVLTLADTENVPSLPGPRGIDRVRVRDASGSVLFEDDFSGGPDPAWTVSGGALIHDGVVGSSGDALLALTGRDWTDVMVEVTYRNVQSATIVARATDAQYGVVATVRPFHWNEDATKWLSVGTGRPGVQHLGTDIKLSRTQSMKSLVAMLARPYPYALLLAAVALAAVTALHAAGVERRAAAWWGALPDLPAPAAPGIAAAFVLLVTAGFAWAHREHMPFVPDAVAYLFQAKIFASGRLTTDPPPVEGAFDFFRPMPFVLRESSWGAQFPFAHPLVLALGQVAGVPWLMPPVLAAGSAALIFCVGRAVYAPRVGALAALLLATSPFFLMNATNLMSHNTGGFFLLACLACLTAPRGRPLLWGVLAGIAFGLLLNTRPLTAAALMPPFGVYLLLRLLPAAERRGEALRLAGFVAGAAVLAGMFLGWNYALTGDPFETGYQSTGVTFFDVATPEPPVVPQPTADAGAAPAVTEGGGGAGDVIAGAGEGGQHDSALGIQNERIQLALLLLVLHGWPQVIGLTFSLLPFLLGTRRLHDWFFLACAASTTAVWVLYESSGVMYGPRYWYEAMPFLILLAARGADHAATLLAAAAARLRRDGAAPSILVARGAVYGLVCALVLYGVNAWLLGNRPGWQADLVPNTSSAACCILGIDDRIHRLVEERGLEDALVLVDPCGNNFVCFGSVFWRNSPALDGDIVYARDDPRQRDALIAAYPGRAVYLATYGDATGGGDATLEPLEPR